MVFSNPVKKLQQKCSVNLMGEGNASGPFTSTIVDRKFREAEMKKDYIGPSVKVFI